MASSDRWTCPRSVLTPCSPSVSRTRSGWPSRCPGTAVRHGVCLAAPRSPRPRSLLLKSLEYDPPREIASEAPFCDCSGPSGVVLRSFQCRFTVAEDFFNRLLGPPRPARRRPAPPGPGRGGLAARSRSWGCSLPAVLQRPPSGRCSSSAEPPFCTCGIKCRARHQVVRGSWVWARGGPAFTAIWGWQRMPGRAGHPHSRPCWPEAARKPGRLRPFWHGIGFLRRGRSFLYKP